MIRVLGCLLLVFGLSFAWLTLAGDRGPVIPKGKGDQCVAETDFMRRNHMDLIVHQRDETVIRGIRDEPFSLVECVDCHVQRDTNNEPMRVDAQGQFCASCHAYVAVKIDCFGCHAAVPDIAAIEHSLDHDTAHGTDWLPNKQLLAFKHPVQNPEIHAAPVSLKSALGHDHHELKHIIKSE